MEQMPEVKLTKSDIEELVENCPRPLPGEEVFTYIPASLISDAEKERDALKERLERATELLEMSQSLVPKREPTCKTGTACMCCTLRDHYHELLTAFLTTQGE